MTHGHPFFVEGRGWVHAENLRIGDRLRTSNGGWCELKDVFDHGDVEPVFNMQVAEGHTYFVQTDSGTWVLAHNGSHQKEKLLDPVLRAIDRGLAPAGNLLKATQGVTGAFAVGMENTVKGTVKTGVALGGSVVGTGYVLAGDIKTARKIMKDSGAADLAQSIHDVATDPVGAAKKGVESYKNDVKAIKKAAATGDYQKTGEAVGKVAFNTYNAVTGIKGAVANAKQLTTIVKGKVAAAQMKGRLQQMSARNAAKADVGMNRLKSMRAKSAAQSVGVNRLGQMSAKYGDRNTGLNRSQWLSAARVQRNRTATGQNFKLARQHKEFLATVSHLPSPKSQLFHPRGFRLPDESRVNLLSAKPSKFGERISFKLTHPDRPDVNMMAHYDPRSRQLDVEIIRGPGWGPELYTRMFRELKAKGFVVDEIKGQLEWSNRVSNKVELPGKPVYRLRLLVGFTKHELRADDHLHSISPQR